MTKLAAVVLAASVLASAPLAADPVHPGESGKQPPHFLQVAEEAIQPRGAIDAAPAVPASTFEAEQFALNASPVAEPGTWALLGLGIVGLGLARRRLANSRGRD